MFATVVVVLVAVAVASSYRTMKLTSPSSNAVFATVVVVAVAVASSFRTMKLASPSSLSLSAYPTARQALVEKGPCFTLPVKRGKL